MFVKKMVLGATAILVAASLLFAQQPQQQPSPPLRLKNHPEVGIESPENRTADLAAASAERFLSDAAITKANGKLAAADATAGASCIEPASQSCYTAKAEYRSRLAELFQVEQQAAEHEANFQATLARRIEEVLERGPDTSGVSTEIRNLMESCGDSAYCKELRTRMYAVLSKHGSEWEEAIVEARKALLMARQAEKHFRDLAYQQQAQRVLALRDTADFQHLAELKRLTAEVLAASEKTTLPRGTIAYAGLVKSKRD